MGAGDVAGAAGGAGMGAGEGFCSEVANAGMDYAAGAAVVEDDVAEVAMEEGVGDGVVYIPLIAGAGADNDAGAAGGAGMDAEDCAGADEKYAAGFDEASAMQQLCELLRRPLADGKSKFSRTSPSFQEWVCALLDCWKGEDGAWMRTRIQRLTALPRSARAKKAHPLDGLVTWRVLKKKYEDDGKLGKSFQFRASSIYRRVTRGLHESVRPMCEGYTLDHIERVVAWHRETSVTPKPHETAEMVKSALKNHFGCMNPRCDGSCKSFDVDHVNCKMKTAGSNYLITKKKCPTSVYQVCRELTMTQNLCVACHREKGELEDALKKSRRRT